MLTRPKNCDTPMSQKSQKGSGNLKKSKTEIDRQIRRTLMTINNPKEKGLNHEKIIEVFATKFKSVVYIALTDEIGENGTFHTHILVCFSSGVRFSTLKKHFNEAHIDACKGTIEDNILYLKKSGKWADTKKAETSIEGSFEEWGTKPNENAGKRIDMAELYQMIADGLTNAEILAINQDYILQLDKLDKLRYTLLQEKFGKTRRIDIQTIYVTGETGTGKSRDILDTEGDDRVYRITDYKNPWDGYSCEPVVVFEEFRSNIPIGEMLQLLDVYPMQLRARYTNRFACYLTCYIVSNWALEEQYANIDADSWRAFIRRIHKVKVYKSKDEIIEYSSVEAYYDRDNSFVPVAELPKEEQLSIPFNGKEVN